MKAEICGLVYMQSWSWTTCFEFLRARVNLNDTLLAALLGGGLAVGRKRNLCRMKVASRWGLHTTHPQPNNPNIMERQVLWLHQDSQVVELNYGTGHFFHCNKISSSSYIGLFFMGEGKLKLLRRATCFLIKA